MKLVLILLLHPAHVGRYKGPLPWPVLHAFLGMYLIGTGMAFQHLYPRLLNNVPWLGFVRRLHPVNWNPGPDLDLFFRGAGMGLWAFLVSAIVLIVISRLPPRRNLAIGRIYLCALGTISPFLYCCLAGLILYHIHPVLGLLPAYGLLAGLVLHCILLLELLSVQRAALVYLCPAILLAQLYGCLQLMP